MIRLIDSTGVDITGARVVVLGRSDIVGSPVAAMLRKRDATVTQCHSRTRDLPEIVRTPYSLETIVFNAMDGPDLYCGYLSLRDWQA